MSSSTDFSRSHAYQTYLRVRDAVVAIQAAASSGLPGTARPSRYWEEELENFDYMLEASPRIIQKLRHHTFHITGLRTYDYRSSQINKQRTFELRYRGLLDLGGNALRVPEARELGGFGYEIDGQLYNADTLKFWEVLIGMDRAGALAPFRQSGERRLVWEVGAGWGGFPFQFKTLFPNVTCVVTDFPELFLFSATYLGAMFPEARWLIYRGEQDQAALAGWRNLDFVFLPTTFPDVVPPGRPDLCVNMVSFQEMTTEQVREYCRKAASLEAGAFYSLNRDRSTHNMEVTNVRSVMQEHFDITEIPLLESDYTSAMTGGSQKPRLAPPQPLPDGKEDLSYRHVVGRHRPGPVVSAAVGPDQDEGVASARSSGEAAVSDEGTVTPARRWPNKIDPASVTVAIGMTLYNNAKYLPQAVTSLQNQTWSQFGLALVDDQSTDKTEIIARKYAARDGRIRYSRNPRRLGMTATWRRAFEHARKTFPNARYFAWASDHDVWTPRWLETLVAEIEANPQFVLVYPYTKKIGDRGKPFDEIEPTFFETAGLASLEDRWKHTCARLIGAGNMVYGLVRVEALARAGVFRSVLLPDRLLMAELTLQGQFRQIPEVLWYRRQLGVSSLDRQRGTLFGTGRPPLHAYLPWYLVHAAALVLRYGLRPAGPVRPGVWRMTRMAARYTWTQVLLMYRKKRLEFERRHGGFKKFRDTVAIKIEHVVKPVREFPWRLGKRLDKAKARREKKRARERQHQLKQDLTPVVLVPLKEEIALHARDLAKRIKWEQQRLRDDLPGVIHEELRAELPGLVERQIRTDLPPLVADLLRSNLPGLLEQQLAEVRDGLRVQLNELRKMTHDAPPGSAARALVEDQAFGKLARGVTENGRTMLGYERLYTLWQAVKNVHDKGLPAAEVGCYRGGASHFLADAFQTLLGREVEFHAFDTFEGHPAGGITPHDTAHRPGMFGDASYEDVREYLGPFSKLTVHKGEFSMVAPTLAERTYGLVHVDTDLYLGTLKSLEYFGPRMAPGGIIVVDDYGAPKCPGVALAVAEFLRSANGFTAWQLPVEQMILVRSAQPVAAPA